ncbi:MAG TPA: hypothetical protein VMK65_08685 [Longimicrobiales bacterium]|nr:hypothetical protein [Longimicrobiales bacterium]
MDEDDVVIEPTPRWLRAAMLLVAVAALAGVLLWLVEEPADAQEIVLLRPAEGTEVGGPVELIFETPAPLTLGPRGWMAGEAHLHASVDGRELMPAAADIESVGAQRFRWVIPALAPGERTLRLYWSDMSHRPLDEGASREVRVRARADGP